MLGKSSPKWPNYSGWWNINLHEFTQIYRTRNFPIWELFFPCIDIKTYKATIHHHSSPVTDSLSVTAATVIGCISHHQQRRRETWFSSSLGRLDYGNLGGAWLPNLEGQGWMVKSIGNITWYNHLVMINIAMENPNHRWRFLAGKIIYFYGPFSMANCWITRGQPWKMDNVGGLEHGFYFPSYMDIWDVILPIDLHIFQDG